MNTERRCNKTAFKLIENLGCKDSNLGMAGPEPAALPLGDTPSDVLETVY